jgi:hypothetical protein
VRARTMNWRQSADQRLARTERNYFIVLCTIHKAVMVQLRHLARRKGSTRHDLQPAITSASSEREVLPLPLRMWSPDVRET